MIILVRGIPGSGKTTFAKGILNSKSNDLDPLLHIEADMYHTQFGKYNWTPEKVPLAHGWCQETTEIYIKNNWNVIVSNTFTTLKEMQFYIDLAEKLNVDIQIYRCFGQWESVHNVPVDVIEKMKNRFEEYPGEIKISGL